MVSRDEIDRLRREADTILTRYGEVQSALDEARSEAGDHWDSGTLELALETPRGEPIDVAVDLESDPSREAERRYDRANELEGELERQERVDDRLDPMAADPVAYLLCYHLDAVGGDYPKSIAGHVSAERSHVERLCEELEGTGLLERVESGTVKQRRVKAKMAEEVRQHHTYYRLSRAGDHLLRYLSEEEGKVNVLRQLPAVERLARHLVTDGPDSPRRIASASDQRFEAVRHRARLLRRIGLAVVLDGRPEGIDATGHTFYRATGTAETVLDER